MLQGYLHAPSDKNEVRLRLETVPERAKTLTDALERSIQRKIDDKVSQSRRASLVEALEQHPNLREGNSAKASRRANGCFLAVSKYMIFLE